MSADKSFLLLKRLNHSGLQIYFNLQEASLHTKQSINIKCRYKSNYFPFSIYLPDYKSSCLLYKEKLEILIRFRGRIIIPWTSSRRKICYWNFPQWTTLIYLDLSLAHVAIQQCGSSKEKADLVSFHGMPM